MAGEVRPVVLEARDVRLSFGSTVALDGASVQVREGDTVAILGPSGAGKSTMLLCLGGILVPDAGDVLFYDTPIGSLSEASRARLRREEFGFVFQFGLLVPELTALDNVALPLRLAGLSVHQANERAMRVARPPGGGGDLGGAGRRDVWGTAATSRRRASIGGGSPRGVRGRADGGA